MDDIVRRGYAFSIGFDCDERIRAAGLGMPEQAWQPTLDADGHQRPGAWVCEHATVDVAGAGWPQGTPGDLAPGAAHPGARHKMGFT